MTVKFAAKLHNVSLGLKKIPLYDLTNITLKDSISHEQQWMYEWSSVRRWWCVMSIVFRCDDERSGFVLQFQTVFESFFIIYSTQSSLFVLFVVAVTANSAQLRCLKSANFHNISSIHCFNNIRLSFYHWFSSNFIFLYKHIWMLNFFF